MDTEPTLKERYDAKVEKIHALEREQATYRARGEAVPSRIRFDLMHYCAELEELRLWGHREMVREAEEAQAAAVVRNTRGRVRAEWERIDALPVLSPEEMRRKRLEMGVRQQDVATAAGVTASTVSRAENGAKCETLTLKNIAAGLEWLEESARVTPGAHARAHGG